MTSTNQHELIERIHASGKQIVLAVTGGGSGAIAALLEVPGASAAVLEAIVPYAERALEDWLGGPVEHACSERTARAMAMAAFERAREFSAADPHTLRGIGATASLVSNRPKRGPHRVHVAWQSADMTVALSCELEKGRRNRAEEERIATCLLLDVVAEACGVAGAPLTEPTVRATVQRREQRASAAWTELLLGRRSMLDVPPQQPPARRPAVLFPGAFNPLHVGHQRIAEVAAARCGAPVTFELSIANVDKPPLDFIELADRLGPLAAYPVLVTRAARFVEKAGLAPGCVFVVGVDTLARIGQQRYYGDDAARRDAAIVAIAREGCRFLVFGRQKGERFCTLADVDIPESLRALCDGVPEAEFRADISSTELRKKV
jgi:nicotinamide mononucleotide (NMN) deamidase PncC/nicotinic acid mononucleotide adenylyltransferase